MRSAAPGGDPANTRRIVLHLVSPASGDLVEHLARTVVAQLRQVITTRRIWQTVRDRAAVERTLEAIAGEPGFVLHTLIDPEIRSRFEHGCGRLGVPFRFVLGPFVEPIATHFGAEVHYKASPRVVMDEAFSRRLEAMRYTLGHDDGLGLRDLEQADVVLIGASRVTKTPTCMYLAHRGIKAANVSLVGGAPLPDALVQARGPLKVGLTIAPRQLARIRRERAEALGMSTGGAYDDPDAVADEVTDLRRQMVRQGWPVIDVTRKSIDKTASLILELLEERQHPASRRS